MGGEDSFKHILRNKCKTKYENNLLPLDLTTVKKDGAEEAMAKHKLAMFGNIKFIGALLKNGMLDDVELIQIAWDLCDANALESLTYFLTAIGPTFDQRDFEHYEHLQAIFEQVEEKSKDKSITTRVRVLLSN